MRCLKPYQIYGSVFSHPCGGCAGCRLRRSREWAVRCTHEASLYSENSFITLTYSDKSLFDLEKKGLNPLSIYKSEFQEFMREFRRGLYPRIVRYFGCGEYGGDIGRPHYHFICFNYDPRKHAVYYDDRPAGEDYLLKTWGKGFVNVRDFNFERAQYVAKYIMKKLGGEKSVEYEKAGIEPEFGLMSTRPGIGYGYFEKFKGGMLDDEIFCAGKSVMVPRYYRKKLEEEIGDSYVQERRKRVSEFRIGAAEEIVKSARAEGKRRDPSKYFKEIVSQRNKDFNAKELRRKINGKG